MKLSWEDVYILGRNAVDRARERYYRESGPDVSGAALMDEIIADLSRIKSMYAIVEGKDSDSEDEFI